MKDGICLFWDLLHTLGLLLVIVYPFETCVSGLILGLLWKREIKVAINILCYLFWWYAVSYNSYIHEILSTFILFIISPRCFNEIFDKTLTVQCIWILNLIYPLILYNKEVEDNHRDTKTQSQRSSRNLSVSIILCNKNESIQTLGKSINSILVSKSYAEINLSIQCIRFILADGGSNNIEEIRKQFRTIFDDIRVIPGGKLSGRHECTVAEDSDVIIAYDSDRKYSLNSTYELIKPFIDDVREQTMNENKTQRIQVVGTTCYPHSDGIFPFNGGNSAYLRSVYLMYPFDTNIPQSTTSYIWKEEELDWGENLSKCGVVVCVNSTYDDINPLPFIPFLKRMLNMKNSFCGGLDRWTNEETTFMVFCKIIFIFLFSTLFHYI